MCYEDKYPVLKEITTDLEGYLEAEQSDPDGELQIFTLHGVEVTDCADEK